MGFSTPGLPPGISFVTAFQSLSNHRVGFPQNDRSGPCCMVIPRPSTTREGQRERETVVVDGRAEVWAVDEVDELVGNDVACSVDEGKEVDVLLPMS